MNIFAIVKRDVYLKYSKEFGELQNDYPLAPDKMETKRETYPTINYRLQTFTISLLAMLRT